MLSHAKRNLNLVISDFFEVTLLKVIISQKHKTGGSTVVKVLCYKSEGRWFDPSWCQWIFH